MKFGGVLAIVATAIAALFGVGASSPREEAHRRLDEAPQDDRKDAATRPRPAPPEIKDDGPLVVLTGNERGFIRPCGCSKPKLGGVDKRATALSEVRSKNQKTVVVATGGLLAEGGRQQELKLDAFLLSMSLMEYAAFTPGPDDFKVGAAGLVERAGMASFPFVLANASVGETRFVGSVPLGETGGALIGLIAPMPPESGVVTTPAAEALAREFATVGDSAFVLVVYNGPDEDLAKLAESVPEAARSKTIFATPGHADAPMLMPKPVLGMPHVVPGGKGRGLGLVRPLRTPLVDAYLLEETIASEPTTKEILDGYRRAVSDEDLLSKVNRLPNVGRYVGDAKCAECHRQAHDDVLGSRHQRAFATLEESGDARDPECVKCHVTGYAIEGGFRTAAETPERKDVDCEQCHGPGEGHALRMEKTPSGKVDSGTCLRCHDPDNSPQFKFDVYWPKIVHR